MHRFYSIGAIAQLVEHRTENPGVPGSIPGGTTAKPLKPPLILGFSGALQFMLMEALMDLEIGIQLIHILSFSKIVLRGFCLDSHFIV